MKLCPKCNHACGESDEICLFCGHVFEKSRDGDLPPIARAAAASGVSVTGGKAVARPNMERRGNLCPAGVPQSLTENVPESGAAEGRTFAPEDNAAFYYMDADPNEIPPLARMSGSSSWLSAGTGKRGSGTGDGALGSGSKGAGSGESPERQQPIWMRKLPDWHSD